MFEPFCAAKVHSLAAMSSSSNSSSKIAKVSHLGFDVELSDEELVARALDGDSWAKEVIYRRHASQITGVAARLLGNASEAEDLCQDTFVDAFQDLRKLSDPSALGSWLTSITVHRAHKIFRRRKLRRRLGLVQIDSDLPALLERPVSSESWSAMMDIGRILDSVSATQRTCWWLRYGEGYSLQEVASAHDVSLATAKRKIATVHKKLAAMLGQIEEEMESTRNV